MKIEETNPPRHFYVGLEKSIQIADCGTIELEVDEKVTFVTPSGTEFDVTRKDFGYYATPSLNARLPAHGLRPALIRNPSGKYYLLLIEKGRETFFENYLHDEEQAFIAWLDDDASFAPSPSRSIWKQLNSFQDSLHKILVYRNFRLRQAR